MYTILLSHHVVLAMLFCVCVFVLFSHSLHPNVLEIPASAFQYKDSLISNLAYIAYEPKVSLYRWSKASVVV